MTAGRLLRQIAPWWFLLEARWWGEVRKCAVTRLTWLMKREEFKVAITSQWTWIRPGMMNCEASFWKSMNNRCCAFAAPTAVFILRIALSSHCLLCCVRLLFYLVFHYLYVCAAWNNCNDQLMKRRMCWGAKQCKSWLQRQVCWKGKLVFFQVFPVRETLMPEWRIVFP